MTHRRRGVERLARRVAESCETGGVKPEFKVDDVGNVRIELAPEFEWLQELLEDSLGTRPALGDDSLPPSTSRLDRVLALMHRSDGSRIVLSSGNMGQVVLDGATVTASAIWDTSQAIELGAWEFEMLLRAWRRAALEAKRFSASAYVEEYPTTCLRTHASLRVFVADLSPDGVSHLLSCTPTTTRDAGRPTGPTGRRDLVGWFLSSKGVVESRDARPHVDFVLDSVDLDELAALVSERAAFADVFCYWLSKGHGGPRLDPGQMSRLVRAGIGIEFDCYHG